MESAILVPVARAPPKAEYSARLKTVWRDARVALAPARRSAVAMLTKRTERLSPRLLGVDGVANSTQGF